MLMYLWIFLAFVFGFVIGVIGTALAVFSGDKNKRQ